MIDWAAMAGTVLTMIVFLGVPATVETVRRARRCRAITTADRAAAIRRHPAGSRR